MTTDVDLRLVQGDAAIAPTRTASLWFIAGAIVCAVALALRGTVPFNVDVSWWLIVGERVFDGQRLYVDIFETNPPMAGSIYFLAVAIARVVGMRPEIVTDALVFGLMAASLMLTGCLLRASKSIDHAASGALAVWALVLLGILPMYDFGQREHLALLFMLPSLAVTIRRAGGERVSISAVVIAGVSAAITMSFKPYFALGVGAGIVAAALYARRWQVLFALENWIAAALVALYGLWVYLYFPAYFTLIYPVVRDVYLLLTAPWLALLASAATVLWLAATLTVLVLQRHRKMHATVVVLLAASFGYAIAFFIQRKGWGYHAYPMVALALMALGCAMAGVDRSGLQARRMLIAASVVSVALLVNAMIWFDASVDVSRLETAVGKLGPHPKILMLGGAATIAHPLVRDVGGVWVSRQEALLIREIVRRARQDQQFDADASARLDRYVAAERDGLVADFRKLPPDVLLVDNRNSDWTGWAQADPELSVLMKPYARVDTVDGIDVLQRTPLPKPTP